MKNNYNLADLHIHTKYSDGTDDVDSLLKEIDRKGITIFSVTDHDTVDFYKNLDYSELDGVRLIPGIEFSCKTDVGKCHMLGYGIDVNNPVLQNTIEQGQKRRSNKLTNRLRYLEEYHHIIFDDITKALLAITPSVGKPHIAEQIVRIKKAESITEAIDNFLTGIPGDADDKIDAKVAIESIVAAGGIPVWAHPLGEGGQKLDKDKFEVQLNVLLKYGIKGLECYYSQYNDKEINFVLNYANKNHLFISGGSDYHGEVKNIPLGKLLQRDLSWNNCIGRELNILQGLGIDKSDERFKNCTYDEMKHLCKKITICYRGNLLDKLKNGEGYFYRKCFDSYTKVFDNSSLFKKRCYDEIKDYDEETVYESKNGLINILVSDYDPLAYWDFSCDENDCDVVTAVSNYSDEFLSDIIKAYEEFNRFKIYHQRYESNYGTRWLVISDEEINDDEWSDCIKV